MNNKCTKDRNKKIRSREIKDLAAARLAGLWRLLMASSVPLYGGASLEDLLPYVLLDQFAMEFNPDIRRGNDLVTAEMAKDHIRRSSKRSFEDLKPRGYKIIGRETDIQEKNKKKAKTNQTKNGMEKTKSNRSQSKSKVN
ncbi:hypothetical protein Tco_1111732 [Tanacetum coccineum]|uniref:Uncharacterized protein n=1 Tax=Tanacetum coccineum TaxID=301880 RepID=A0ABQ5IQY0_9ASTR